MSKFHPAFNPLAVPAAQLEEITVGEAHNVLIERLSDRIIRAATSEARPHSLVIGPYGSGKTHTLQVAAHRAMNSRSTREKIAIAWISENDFGISSYEKLLVEATRSLDISAHARAQLIHEDKEPPRLQQSIVATRPDLSRAHDATHVALDSPSHLRSTQRVEEIFLEAAGGRTVILIVENLQRMFSNIRNEGQAALRGLVETQKSIFLFGSAPALFPEMSNRTKPWYGSFNVERMPELTVNEVVELLTRISPNKALAKRLASNAVHCEVATLHQTLGGTPRIWNLIAKSTSGQSDIDWGLAQWDTFDILSPHFQSKLLALSPLEQRIIRFLGLHDKSSVTDLARHVSTSVSTAASTLSRLARSGLVQSEKTPEGDQRVTFYSLRERLLGLWMTWSFANDHATEYGHPRNS